MTEDWKMVQSPLICNGTLPFVYQIADASEI